MPINAEKKQFYKTCEIKITSKNEVSTKLELTEEEATSVIIENAIPFLEIEECGTSEVRYGGKVYFTVVTGLNGVKKTEAGVEFMYKEQAQKVNAGDLVIGDATVDNVKVTVKNGIVTASAVLIYTATVYQKQEESYLYSLEGANVKKAEVNSLLFPTKYKSNFTVENEFEVPFVIADVLYHEERVKLTSVSAGIGSVIIEGEVELSMLIKTHEGGLVRHVKCLPMRYEGDASDVLPSSIISVCACVKGANLSVTSYEQTSKSTVSAFVNVGFSGLIYEVEQLRFISDAYSIKNELILDKKEYKTTEITGVKCTAVKAETQGSLKIKENAGLICPLFVKIESVETSETPSGLNLNGVASATVIISNEGVFETVKVPVNYSTRLEESCLVKNVTPCNLEASVSGGKISVTFDLNLTLVSTENKATYALFEVQEGEERPVNDSAISICVPKESDTLWDLCKSLGALEEEVLKLNPELNFPLTGDERVVIYREINKE
ncbi:MAG: hypothetical protein IKL82_01135 [Clostridia bacterium]|nr:hypothetical protein [Clostridia bacterium]